MSLMAGLRSQLAWLVRGRSDTVRTLDALSVDLRELQQKVVGLQDEVVALTARAEDAVAELRLSQAALRERQLDELDRAREAVANATDDLSARLAALHARLDPGSGAPSSGVQR
jgi:predicted  nucleic acid-binding Zn-ribbon protein